MRLLFVTETVPYPLDSGGRIKTFNTLAALSTEHEVHCHAFIRDPAQGDAARTLQQVVSRVSLHLVPRSVTKEARFAFRSLLTNVPYTVLRHFDPDVMRTLVWTCRRMTFDAVYCDHLSMLEYGRQLQLPLIHDAHNVEFEIVRRYAHAAGWGVRRMAAEIEWRRIRRYEERLYRRCALIYTVSEVDARQVRAMSGPAPRIAVVPIGVDAAGQTAGQPWSNGLEVLFVGALDWPPNRDAVQYLLAEIWPRVLARYPSAHLTVVGRGSADFGASNVTFTGWVADVTPYFAAARALAVPIRSGSGMRVKILDSLSRGVPVIATSIGMEGIEATSGQHLIAADDPEDFAVALVRVLGDDKLVRSLSEQGRRLALERYDRSVVTKQILDSLRSAERAGGADKMD